MCEYSTPYAHRPVLEQRDVGRGAAADLTDAGPARRGGREYDDIVKVYHTGPESIILQKLVVVLTF